MVINENNSYTNTFTKGMNTDTVYDQVDNQQYVYGKNVRITKNDIIGGVSNNFSSVHEGIISPVSSGNTCNFEKVEGEFLGSDTINDIAVVITKQTEDGVDYLKVWRAKINNDSNDSLYTDGFEEWWKCTLKVGEKDKIVQVSTVTYLELEGVIKLYIATGIYPVIEIRINDGANYSGLQNIDYFINNRILPQYPVWIDQIVDGSLKTSQVQYTYRYYDKFGITTLLAPLTNKIQVIDSNRSKETGNAQDTTTSIGFKLIIKNTDEYSKFKRLQIFRLSYITPGENAKVELIYDGDVPDTNDFVFNDVGTTPLLELTMEEFSAMSGMVVIPTVIELNQLYMFAANVKDDTIIPNLTINKGNYITLYNDFTVKLSTNIEGIPEQDSSIDTNLYKENYLKDRNVNPACVKNSYNNIFTSSLLRSLRRGEDYQYGIVYYDKFGRRSNVQLIGKVHVDEISSNNNIISKNNNTLDANICGVEIKLPLPLSNGELARDIIGCLIVRRSSKKIYQKTLLLVALARPIRQKTYITDIKNLDAVVENDNIKPDQEPKNSPYYPTGFLWANYTRIYPGYMKFGNSYTWDTLIRPDIWYNVDGHQNWQQKNTDYFTATSKDNNLLFLIFSSEIDFRRDDILSELKSLSTSLHSVFGLGFTYIDGNNYYDKYNKVLGDIMSTAEIVLSPYDTISTSSLDSNRYSADIFRWRIYQTAEKKASEKLIFPLYDLYNTSFKESEIKSTKDVKIPLWFEGFSNLLLGADDGGISSGGIKKYKEFTTNIDNYTFNNWVSGGLYDIRIGRYDNQPNNDADRGALFLSGDYPKTREDLLSSSSTIQLTELSYGATRGWIGPGSSCFLTTVDEQFGKNIATTLDRLCSTVICNIQHDIATGESEPDEFIQYFGFGNYFKLKLNPGSTAYEVVHNYGNSATDDKMLVFDGDIYITPQEITTMYKTYDFMSYDTLQSTQITNYVPMESKVNTFFDYGMNLLNTNSSNLLVEPGSIDGITTQDRPAHQYNQIYSANDESNDVFTLVVEKSEDNQFKLRTYYSEPKINGEYIDNFVIFKPVLYIDVDPKYGEITNLLTDKNILYYWQDTAFGKFSINERSLINDTNGNTIMLGQSGILSRNDYISTKYGMRPYDYCATGAENGVYWVDINNRAIVAGNSNECINLGERLNVLNIINKLINSDDRPKIDYDLLNNELLCLCLKENDNKELIIFNLKFNIPTAIYTRDYTDIFTIKNHIYGYKNNSITRYNYLKNYTNFLTPMEVSFVVNPASSVTKTFDSQLLIPIKRAEWNSSYEEKKTTYFENSNCTYSFETDINNTKNTIEPYTDREGNITYNIPRFGNNEWGNRLRGKWMRVDFSFKNPLQYTTISHVITKFRQSYS